MKKFIVTFVLACIVSMFFFPIEFTFLPSGLNTKKMMAALGIVLFVINKIKDKDIRSTWSLIGAAIGAVIFSLWCNYCITANGTNDDSYSTYYLSFAVWLGGAYTAYCCLKAAHGRVDIPLLTRYLALVCVAQCVLALMIDNIPSFKHLVDSIVFQGNEFLDSVNRLYGIGASLDPAGVRFSIVLVLIAHQIATNAGVQETKRAMYQYIIAFIAITIVGNMISRTTIIGVGLGLVYMFLYMGFAKKGVLSARQVRFYSVMGVLITAAVVVSVILYNTDSGTRENLRFAFEGFFNWVETGRWSTGSTDKLNNTMWIWPNNPRSWIIGTGWFGNFVYATDIGYCRFVLYCGLVGMAIFSLFFVYNALVLPRKFKNVGFLAFMLIVSTFVFWIKVATDIFFIYALFFCIDGDYDEEGNEILSELEQSVIEE